MDKKVINDMIFSKMMIYRIVIFATMFAIFWAFTKSETQNSVNIGLVFIMIFILMISLSLLLFFLSYCCGHEYRCYKKKRNIVPIKRAVPLEKGIKIPAIRKIINCIRSRFSFIHLIILYFLGCLDIITDYNGRKNQNLMSETPEYRSDLEHNEIVIAPSKGLKSAYFTYGPDDLFKYFQKNKIPYRVTICESTDDFERLIIDDTAAVLWLFGHGNIGGYLTGNHEIVWYSKYQEEPYVSHRKKAIYQLHCNSKNLYHPNPLSRILVDGWDFREKGNNNSADNKAFVRFAIENKEEFPGIWDSI